jgi:hypothetical protein
VKFRAAIALIAWLFTASVALAAGTTSYQITSTTFTDLGAAPLQIQTLGQPVAIIVADSQPSVATAGSILLPGPPVIFQPADTSSHVWAAFLGASTTIVATPVYSTGGSGGITPIYSYTSAGVSQFISAATLASATGLTVPTGATIAQICVETSGVRYRDDGTNPTAAVGIPFIATLTSPNCFQYAGSLSAIKFILISGSPTMDISYYIQ